MIQRLHGILVWLALCLSGLQTQAQGIKVHIVSSQASAPYLDAAQALIKGLSSHGVARSEIQVMSLADFSNVSPVALPTGKVWVALGTQAAAALAKAQLRGASVLSALIPGSGFERVLRQSGRQASAQFNAIYLDQPLQRQLVLIRLALPRAKRVAVLWGPESWNRADTLRTLANTHGLVLRDARLKVESDLFAALQSVLDGSDVLLAQADPLVFNSSSIQNILMTSIRDKVPLVAFSPAYVRAGALLAIYSTPTQVGTQAARWVLDVLAQRTLPEQAMAPDDFEISVNLEVARVLNLPLDAGQLQLSLKRLEQP
ncbi:ABC transporter substrate-binding protein [Rhodoferax sp.]|uniref:ABC transporter substrate-binding protein n=1 Tax=Rhodoferax sp. TaxID=50421 RepID=UPI0008BA1116|nr:ABC transporter substrate binding protein [Rhodoferax sp.]OGB54945.1 MAG: hypothetical protein A2503_15535 [Burkholderiales bacterium RIFOXYD12_FULL_59_19]OGB81374.1 MAG: hypothetical protein A2496_20570 [Burkholderiales bacterium RIFOXYC12_FULL_60_6]OGB81562.1 MAG: hypothetical protein A2535_06425 [Burkholderiales bacterium RIFOXYD2_FULL_59_8]MDO8318375.1 ABC transporter substrate binding protein [Rhodoferax sp.]MDP2679815.1 ABC transporter substrate binding protein [Rhodoferax sp.]